VSESIRTSLQRILTAELRRKRRSSPGGSHAKLAREAMEWVLQLRRKSRRSNTENLHDFKAWLLQSPEHGTYLLLAYFCLHVEEAKHLPGFSEVIARNPDQMSEVLTALRRSGRCK
jgi:hypothetical protein